MSGLQGLTEKALGEAGFRLWFLSHGMANHTRLRNHACNSQRSTDRCSPGRNFVPKPTYCRAVWGGLINCSYSLAILSLSNRCNRTDHSDIIPMTNGFSGYLARRLCCDMSCSQVKATHHCVKQNQPEMLKELSSSDNWNRQDYN